MILPRISHTEVMVLSRECTCLRSALQLARARSAPTQQNLYSPTEFRTHSCWDILPQISQNTQNFLAEIFSHRFHRFTQNFLAGKNSVKSVDSVGDIHALTSVRICEICGSFFNCKLRAVSQGPEHEKINLFLLICSPTDFTDLHRTFLLKKIL